MLKYLLRGKSGGIDCCNLPFPNVGIRVETLMDDWTPYYFVEVGASRSMICDVYIILSGVLYAPMFQNIQRIIPSNLPTTPVQYVNSRENVI